MKSASAIWKKLYSVTRDIHLYLGLFIAPLLLIFAISTILLNHRLNPEPKLLTEERPVRWESGASDQEELTERLTRARDLMTQLDIKGDLRGARYFPERGTFFFLVGKPRESIRVNVDLSSQIATIERRVRGLSGAMIFLHTSPGPHRAPGTMQWMVVKLWSWLTDTTVYVLMILSLSGIYLWAVVRPERKIGLALLVAGGLTFLLLIVGFALG